MLFTTVLCRSLNSLMLMTLGLGALLAVKYLRSFALVAALVALPCVYVVTRSAGIWSGDGLVHAVATHISDDRSRSLKFRFMNEDLLADKALQRPLFGWGGWGRSRVYNEKGEDITITDGLWIIIMGANGIVGVGSLILMLVLPPVVLRCYHPAKQWSHPMIAPAAVLGVISTLYMIDNLPNAMHNPIFLLVAGAGIGYGITQVAPQRRPLLAPGRSRANPRSGAPQQPRRLPIRRIRPQQ